MDYFQLNSSMFKHLASESRRELRRLYVFNSYFKFVANWENCFKYFLDLIKEKCFWTINRALVFIFCCRYRRFLISFPAIVVSAFSTFFVTRRSKLDARVIWCSIAHALMAIWSPLIPFFRIDISSTMTTCRVVEIELRRSSTLLVTWRIASCRGFWWISSITRDVYVNFRKFCFQNFMWFGKTVEGQRVRDRQLLIPICKHTREC